MKFYKKRNEERRKKNHAQKDRCLEVWLLITKYTILYKSPIKVLNNNHKILHNNSQWERYFLINTLYCQVLWSHISKQSYSVWSVPFLLPYMSRSSDGESRKKGSERWRKRWVRQKKKKIFNLAVVIKKEWRRNVKKIKWKIATLENAFIKQEVELLRIFKIWRITSESLKVNSWKKIQPHRKIKLRQYLDGKEIHQAKKLLKETEE